MAEQEKYIPLPAAEVDKLLAKADGNAALLWLHVLRSGGFSLGRAARELKCTEAELKAAADVLRGLGLLRETPENQELPEYTAADLTRRAETDAGYRAVVRETEQTLGRVLSSNDLKLLFGIYDFWGLPTDVIMLLVHRAVEEYQQRYGQGRTPTLRYIEQMARRWAMCEVRTLDDAEALIRREETRREATQRTAEALQIRGRALTKSEREYIERWLDMGFGPEAIAVAYDRTVLSTNRLAWNYLEKILRSWQEKRLFTPEEIEAAEPRRRGGSRSGPAPERSEQDKIDAMRRMLNHGKEKSDGT